MHELELNDATAVEELISICTQEIKDQETLSKSIDLIKRAIKTERMVVSFGTSHLDWKHESIPLAELPNLLAKIAIGGGELGQIDETVETSSSGVGCGRTKAQETWPARQDFPSRIVSAAKTSSKTYD